MGYRTSLSPEFCLRCFALSPRLGLVASVFAEAAFLCCRFFSAMVDGCWLYTFLGRGCRAINVAILFCARGSYAFGFPKNPPLLFFSHPIMFLIVISNTRSKLNVEIPGNLKRTLSLSLAVCS
jgi:hypothetical protein